MLQSESKFMYMRDDRKGLISFISKETTDKQKPLTSLKRENVQHLMKDIHFKDSHQFVD